MNSWFNLLVLGFALFVLSSESSKWSKNNLTYKISKYPSGSPLSHAEVDAELARAFSLWSEYTDLTFTRSSGDADIEIKFQRKQPGDHTTFDGPGGALVSSFSPESGGNIYFDDAEQWTMHSKQGINFFQVAAHAVGNALGLNHSTVPSAVMYPLYQSFDPSFRLHQDDIERIQALYGPKTRKGQDKADVQL